MWVVGAQGDQRLHGYNGDTGAVVYAGGGANELMTGTRKWNSGIAARGSIYVANDNKVYAFRVPGGGTPTPTPTATATATPTPTATATATATATSTPTSTPTATATGYANIDPNCHRNRESDANPQTNTHSETPYDTEAAPDSAAKAVGRPNNWQRTRRATFCAAVNH